MLINDTITHLKINIYYLTNSDIKIKIIAGFAL